MLARCFYCCSLTLLLSNIVCEAITRQEFFGYPFNTVNGNLPEVDDGIRYVNVQPMLPDDLFPFFGEKYRGLQVDINGHIDLSNTSSVSLCDPTAYPLHGRKSVSPFWADLNNRDPGNGGLHYQLYSSNNLPILSDISRAARASGGVDAMYSAKFALVVTWDRIVYLSDTARVTFQAALATDGEVSVAIFNYDRNGIERFKPRTAIGYTSGDGDNFYHMPSFIANQVDTSVGNTGVVGQWVFRIDGGDHNVNAGENVLLDCFIPTAYDVDIQWMKNGTPLYETAREMNTKSAKLTLRNINYSDYGIYQCLVNIAYYTRSVILTVSPLGSVVTIPEMFVSYGDNVTLECKAGGGPSNVYQWEHDGVTIARESTPYLIVNSSLVDPTDLGTYTCVVSNAAGYGEASTLVHGFKFEGPGGGFCTEYLKEIMSSTADICIPTFTTTFPTIKLRHTVYLYSSDTPIEASSVQDEFLQELVGKASVNTNPYIVGVYNDSSAVPVSIPLTNLLPSTYILFVKVDGEWMSYASSRFSEPVVFVVKVSTCGASLGAMGAVIAVLVLIVLTLIILLCLLNQRRVSIVNKKRSDKNSELHQGQACTISMEPNPSYEIVDHTGANRENFYKGDKCETGIRNTIYENINHCHCK